MNRLLLDIVAVLVLSLAVTFSSPRAYANGESLMSNIVALYSSQPLTQKSIQEYMEIPVDSPARISTLNFVLESKPESVHFDSVFNKMVTSDPNFFQLLESHDVTRSFIRSFYFETILLFRVIQLGNSELADFQLQLWRHSLARIDFRWLNERNADKWVDIQFKIYVQALAMAGPWTENQLALVDNFFAKKINVDPSWSREFQKYISTSTGQLYQDKELREAYFNRKIIGHIAGASIVGVPLAGLLIYLGLDPITLLIVKPSLWNYLAFMWGSALVAPVESFLGKWGSSALAEGPWSYLRHQKRISSFLKDGLPKCDSLLKTDR